MATGSSQVTTASQASADVTTSTNPGELTNWGKSLSSTVTEKLAIVSFPEASDAK